MNVSVDGYSPWQITSESLAKCHRRCPRGTHPLTLGTGVRNRGENNTPVTARLSSDWTCRAARGFRVTLMVEILAK